MARKYFTVFFKPGVVDAERTYCNSFAGNFTTGADAINYVVNCFPEFSADQLEAEEISKEAFGKDTQTRI